ncbi:MAG: T9SS type A sorting domain-containing protein, partial [Ignavibacteriota bacterium]
RVIRIKFTSLVPPTVKDTLILTDECIKISVGILGNGGAADFEVHPYAFDCTPLKVSRPSQNYFITNPSGIDISIDSIWLDDNINFGYNVAFPIGNDFRGAAMVIPNSNTLSGQHEIVVTFSPQQLGFISTPIHVRAKGGVVKIDTISGYGCAPDVVSIKGTGVTDCGGTYGFKVPLTNMGTYFDSLTSVKGVSKSAGFSVVQLQDASGNPLTLPFHLDSGSASGIYAAVNFTPAAKACGIFTDTIITTRSNGEIANQTEVTIKAGYREADVSKDNVDYLTQPFGGAKVQDYFAVCNNIGCDSLIITSISSLSTPGTSSFALTNVYKIGPQVVTLPVGLAPTECLDVFVEFDPSLSSVVNQSDSFGISSNACNGAHVAHVLGQITTASAPILGFTAPAILSCDNRTDSVTITNLNTATTETITAIGISGVDMANFKSIIAPPIIIAAGAMQKIPVIFTPTPLAGTKNYSAFVRLTVTDGAGNTKTDSVLVTAIGQGVDLTVSSKFANPVGIPGADVSLPIDLNIDKHGLLTPVTTLGISRIELTYSYDQNILDILGNDIVKAVKLTNSAWTVDAATSKIDPAAGTLQVNISGPALTDADLASAFGTITFRASLPKAGSLTDVKLTTANFITANSQAVGNCVTIARKDSIFTLFYTCGDSTLQLFMNGGTVFSAFPVRPNPAGSANGKILNFTFASRVQGTVSLVIYDQLGKEVARVIRDEYMPAGSFEVHYDTSGLSEGTYIYRFALNNNHVVSGRVVIQK